MMKKLIGTAVGVLLLSAASFAEVTKEDLKKLAEAQVSDGVLIAYIRAHGPVPKMSAQDLIDLKNAGLSDQVLERIAAGEPAVSPRPAPTPVIERRVHVVTPPPVFVPRVWVHPCRPWIRVGFSW